MGQTDTGQEDGQLAHVFEAHVETGFQLATFQGPLCAEPVEGVAYFLESLEVDHVGVGEERRKHFASVKRFYIENASVHNRMAQVTGSLISALKEACRNGLLDWSPRLMLAMYTCDIQASSKSCYRST